MKAKEIGNIIRHHRKRAKLSRIKLADMTGVSKSVIYDIEHGKPTVQYESIRKLLDALNIHLHLDSPLMDEIK